MATSSSSANVEIRQHLDSGSVQQALIALVPAMDRAREDGRLWELLAEIHLARGYSQLAMKALETASCLVPLSCASQLRLARCYEDADRGGLALDIYSHLARRWDLPRELSAELASGLGRCGRFDLALHVCRAACRVDPHDDEAIYGAAYYLRKLGNAPRKVVALLHRAVQLAPERTLYRVALALALREDGQLDGLEPTLSGLRGDQLQEVPCRETLSRLLDYYKDREQYERCQWCIEALRRLPQEQASAPRGRVYG